MSTRKINLSRRLAHFLVFGLAFMGLCWLCPPKDFYSTTVAFPNDVSVLISKALHGSHDNASIQEGLPYLEPVERIRFAPISGLVIGVLQWLAITVIPALLLGEMLQRLQSTSERSRKTRVVAISVALATLMLTCTYSGYWLMMNTFDHVNKQFTSQDSYLFVFCGIGILQLAGAAFFGSIVAFIFTKVPALTRSEQS